MSEVIRGKSQWASSRTKPQVSRLSVWPFAQANIKENLKAALLVFPDHDIIMVLTPHKTHYLKISPNLEWVRSMFRSHNATILQFGRRLSNIVNEAPT